jgi:alkane 1-monooxygenase/p-cymene monooxygenase
MAQYLMYYLPILVQLVTAAGILHGGAWVWFGILSFPLMAIVDSILPRDYSPRRITSHFWANLPVWICTLLVPLLYVVAAVHIRQGDVPASEVVGMILSLGWLSVVPLVPASHELYHQRGALRRFVGRYAQICYLDATREIMHVVGHHIDVGTPRDGDTAVRGTSLYAFTGKAVIDSSLGCWKMESDALEKRGKGRWSIGHRLYKAILAQVLFQSLLFAIGGGLAVIVALGGMIVARFWIESFNYFQHYGLIRVEGTPITRRHVWNHLGFIGRLMGFEITNHADHHLDSYASYYKLVPDRNSIPMPSVFVCFLASLIPPIWDNLIIRPALKRWDLEFASPEERKLARAQNLAAGWPDWFDDAGDNKAGNKHAGNNKTVPGGMLHA